MSKTRIRLFFDSSALVARAMSSKGASRALLILAGGSGLRVGTPGDVLMRVRAQLSDVGKT